MKAAQRLGAIIATDAVIRGIVQRNPDAQQDIDKFQEKTLVKTLLMLLADRAFTYIVSLIQKLLVKKYGL